MSIHAADDMLDVEAKTLCHQHGSRDYVQLIGVGSIKPLMAISTDEATVDKAEAAQEAPKARYRAHRQFQPNGERSNNA